MTRDMADTTVTGEVAARDSLALFYLQSSRLLLSVSCGGRS